MVVKIHFLKFSLMVAAVLQSITAETTKQGYLVNQPDLSDNPRCLVQVTDTKEGTKEYTGNPWDNGYCEMLELTLVEGATFDNGAFTIKVVSTGTYLTELDHEHLGLGEEAQEFGVYLHNYTYIDTEFCENCTFLEYDGINSLLNQSASAHLRFNADIGPRCVNDLYIYDLFYEDDFGTLVSYWPYYGLSDCFTHWWFIEAPESEATTSMTNSTAENGENAGNTGSPILPVARIVIITILFLYMLRE